MLLSIGMIIKNEEENLPRCLDGIKSLLDMMNGEAELIITDTGSTDRSVEIAKTYTDRILHFEWCNDFAAARNVSLDAATGEWFMFLDADEVIMEPEKIADFFLSGEYREYCSATLSFRNYSDVEADMYTLFFAPRLTRKNPGTKFIGVIHEHFSDFSVPVKQIEARVDHFGYVSDPDNALSRSKYERNYPLLLKELENRADDPMVYLQLSEATAIFEPEKSLEYIAQGIDVAKKLNHYSYYTLCFKRIKHLTAYDRYDEALEYIDEYLGTVHEPMGTDIDVYACKGYINFAKKNYSVAIDAYSSYIKMYQGFVKGQYRTLDTLLTSMSFTSEAKMIGCVNNAVIAAIKSEKYNTARALLKNLPLKKYMDNENYIHIRIKQELLIMHGLMNFSYAASLLSEFSDIMYRQSFFNSLLRHITHGNDGEKITAALIKQKFPAPVISALKIFVETRGTLSDERKIAIIKELKELVRQAPELKNLIKYIAASSLRIPDSAEKQGMNSEFEMLAKTVKENIRRLIDDGHEAEAEKTLAEYEKLCPNDEEIIDFRMALGIAEKETFNLN